MTSINTNPPPPSLYVNNLGDGDFRVGGMPGDKDGDGVKDGESLIGPEGKVVNSDGLNEILKNNKAGHLQASGNQLFADGVDVATKGTAAATDFGGMPALPGIGGGSVLGNADVGTKLTWLAEMEDASLMWMAMSTMAQVAMREMKDAKSIRNALQLSKIQGKASEIKSDEQRISAERDSAMNKMITGIVAAVVSAAAGAIGSKVGGTGGGALTGSAAALGNCVTAVGDYIDKAHGARAEADEKQVQAKRWQMLQEVDDQGIEAAKGNYEEAKEQFKKALQIMTEHVERQSQVVQKITS